MDPLVAQGHTGSLARSHGAPLGGQLGVGSRAGFPTVPGLISFEPDPWQEFDHGVKSKFRDIAIQIRAQFVAESFRSSS